MKHGSLFSGIGGFDLAAEWMGWENMFHCEWNKFGQKVLKYYWPNAITYGDITKTDFRKWRGQIDILTGGFPCQPFSQAGKRAGAEDDRYLWPEMLRAIEEIRPSWVVGENVAGITTMVQPYTETKVESQASIFEEGADIITEEAEFVIETICSDLERIGYTVQPIIIPACAVGAPHRRDRVWFVAHCDLHGQQRSNCKYEKQSSKRGQYAQRDIEPSCQHGNIADAEGSKSGQQTEWQGRQSVERGGSDHGRNKTEGGVSITNAESQRSERAQPGEQCENSKPQQGQPGGGYSQNATPYTGNKRLQRIPKRGGLRESREESNKQPTGRICSTWENFPTQPPICGGDDGLPTELDGITFSKWRIESIKAYGNAIVPQVAYEIFKGINEILKQTA